MQLTASQQQALLSFQEISQISDEYLCVEMLQQANWNLDAAVNSFIQGQSDSPVASPSPGTGTRSRVAPGTARNSTTSAVSNNQRSANSDGEEVGRYHSPNNSSIFDMIFLPIKWLFQATPLSLNPDRDSARFVDKFNLRYGDNHPPLHPSSYLSAVATGFQSSKFLLVYLHSPIHEDTDDFCSQVVCSQAFREFTNDRVLMWAGDVWDAEAYSLSTQLRATKFPFLALLVCQSNRAVQIAERIQGYKLFLFCVMEYVQYMILYFQ